MTSYSDAKEAAKDLAALALNGSPYWRVGVTLAVLVLGTQAAFGDLSTRQEAQVDSKIEQAVKPIRDDLAKRQLDDITNSILSAKRDQCDASREGRNASAWTKRIVDLSHQYYRLSGRAFEMPACSEV